MLTILGFHQDTLEHVLNGFLGSFKGFLDPHRDSLWSVFLARKLVLYRAPVVQSFDGVDESGKVVVCLTLALQYLELASFVGGRPGDKESGLISVHHVDGFTQDSARFGCRQLHKVEAFDKATGCGEAVIG